MIEFVSDVKTVYAFDVFNGYAHSASLAVRCVRINYYYDDDDDNYYYYYY